MIFNISPRDNIQSVDIIPWRSEYRLSVSNVLRLWSGL